MNAGWTFAAVIVAGLLAIGGAGVAWYMLPPRAMSFAGGNPVSLSDYKRQNPTGVPIELQNADLLQKGKYLTEAADCQACHTATGGKPFAGGRSFDTGFGILYSPNITSDKETGIGTWSDTDFIRAVHQGVAKDGSHLYPAFPYESYTALTDEDVKAIKAYLFSIPPVNARPPQNEMMFPANQRWLMAFWSAFYNPDKRFEPHTDRSPQWNRGAYLVEALAHCGDCHTPRNLGQALNNRRKFAGAVIDDWRAYNVTQDREAGIGAWTDEQIADYLKTGHTVGRGSAGGPMAEAVDISLSKIAPSDIDAMVTYLRTIPAVATSGFPAPKMQAASDSHREMASDNLRGKRIYEGACVSCHGWSGQSLLTTDATLVGARSVNDVTATNAAQAVLNGIERPSLSMPAFGNAYSDAEIAAVTNYVTARFGTVGSKLVPNEVAELRAGSAPARQ
jgi:mono/diheme cytochrome c family protein